MDAPLVLRRLAALGFTKILHGHQHGRAQIRHVSAEPQRYSIDILAAGSAGVAVPNGGRHFFVHEVDGGAFRTHSFVQSAADPKEFEPSVARDVLEDVACAHDASIRLRRSYEIESVASTQADAPPEVDTSDLNYVFLTVVDCPRARRVFRDAIQSEKYFPNFKLDYFQLSGMYDLLGRWDLVIRFRASPVTVKSKHDLLQPLRDAEMFDVKDAGIERDFDHEEWIDVLKEWKFDSWLNKSAADQGTIHHLRLATSEAYDEARCQRGFIFVRRPSMRGVNIEDRIREVLRKRPNVTSIIESVAVGEHALVFEIFMTCSQSSLVNQLNQALEPALAGVKAQKFTLLCYGYDEEIIRRPSIQ